MLADVGQDLAEVGELLGAARGGAGSRSATKLLHALQTGVVERLQDVERGEQEGARAAGGVERRVTGVHRRRCEVEGAQQFGPSQCRDDVLGELLDIEVVGDEVVDLVDLAARQLAAQISS